MIHDLDAKRNFLTRTDLRITFNIISLALGEEPVVETIRLDYIRPSQRAAQGGARETEVTVVVDVWKRWTDGSHSDDGQVGAAAVGKHCN